MKIANPGVTTLSNQPRRTLTAASCAYVLHAPRHMTIAPQVMQQHASPRPRGNFWRRYAMGYCATAYAMSAVSESHPTHRKNSSGWQTRCP